jgi:hypothetical protein
MVVWITDKEECVLSFGVLLVDLDPFSFALALVEGSALSGLEAPLVVGVCACVVVV